jgi:hypothetical protein
MNDSGLELVADQVLRRAHRQGFVVQRDIRNQLARTGISERRWKEVLSIASPSLRYRNGRYHYKAAVSPQLRSQQQKQRAIRKTVSELARLLRASPDGAERRRQRRIDFIGPVQLRLDSGRELTVLSRDLSSSGIRLIAAESLLGQRLQIAIPRPGGIAPARFVARIIWTCAVGDGLFENGGSFLELAEPNCQPAEK